MARRPHDYHLKQEISIRLQLIVEQRFKSLYGFMQKMEAQERQALASTVRGWLPPQRRWKAKPDGRAVRKVDWEAVRIPDSSTLIEFCDLLSLRADYILLGDGVPSRSQTREQKTLEQDIAAHVADALTANGHTFWSCSAIDAARILTDVVDAAIKEASAWQEVVERAPARVAAQTGVLLEQIGRVARRLPKSLEARNEFLVLAQYGALFEASVEATPTNIDGLKTRYLAVPDIKNVGFPLPKTQMHAKIQVAFKRMENKFK